MAVDRRDVIYVVRPVAAVVVLIALYVLVPVRPQFSVPAAIAVLLLSVALFVVVLVQQQRRITRASRPLVAAIEAIAILVSLFLVAFSLMYVALSETDAGSFSEPIDKLDATYLSVTVLTTTGFGDIVPVSSLARSMVTAHMLVNVSLVAVGIRLVTNSATRALSRRESGDPS